MPTRPQDHLEWDRAMKGRSILVFQIRKISHKIPPLDPQKTMKLHTRDPIDIRGSSVTSRRTTTRQKKGYRLIEKFPKMLIFFKENHQKRTYFTRKAEITGLPTTLGTILVIQMSTLSLGTQIYRNSQITTFLAGQ